MGGKAAARMMYNPQLETFLRVADAGSFNRAAEELFITPPAVIKQITSLETSLDLQLFVRSPRGLKLTEAGKSIYRDAQYVVQYCKDSVVRAKNAAEEGDKVIRIGVSPMTPGQFLLDLWPAIKTHCPNIKFKMVPYENTPENSVEILRNLGQNIDIVAGLFDQNFLENRQCAALELSREPIRCAVSIYHPLAAHPLRPAARRNFPKALPGIPPPRRRPCSRPARRSRPPLTSDPHGAPGTGGLPAEPVHTGDRSAPQRTPPPAFRSGAECPAPHPPHRSGGLLPP